MLRRSLLLLLPWLIIGSPGRSALAQIADVPLPNPAGEFVSTRMAGHRDPYPQRQWLVVGRPPQGLNCLERNGTVVARLAYGAVVDTALPAGTLEGVEAIAGSAWLWLRVQSEDLRQDLRSRELRLRPLICRVRAQAEFVAPINPDTFTPTPDPSQN